MSCCRKGRENAEEKARRLLAEGRLLVRRVGPRDIEALCRGNGAFYSLGYAPGGWYCTCASSGRCSHLIALQLVTVRDSDVDSSAGVS